MSKSKIDELVKAIDTNSAEGKAMKEIISYFEAEINRLNSKIEELEDGFEQLDNEMAMLVSDLDAGFGDFDVEGKIEAVCPYCEETIEIDIESMENDESFICPHCEKEISLEWDCECGCDDCGDDCDCDDDCDCHNH